MHVTLSPGVYIIKDGPLSLSASSSITGDEVVFFFTGTDTKIEVNGGADIDITAPVDGTWKGFAFIQDPLSNPGETSKIQGGGTIEMEGALYTPTWVIELSGNGTMSDDADTWIMVADRFVVKGNSNMYLRAIAQNDDMDKVVVSIAAKVNLTQ